MTSKLQQKLINITTSVAAFVYNIIDIPTVETPKRDLIPRWFQAASPYLNAGYLQQNWNHMDAQYQLTDTVIGVFKQSLTVVKNFSGYLIRLFNDILPPETRYEQILHWLPKATLYLIAAPVLVFFIRCLFTSLGFAFHCLFMFLSFIIRFLFRCISVVKVCFYPVRLIFWCVHLIFWCLSKCLWLGGKSAVKTMKAPGRPAMMIARAPFEANPKAYFSNLRGIMQKYQTLGVFLPNQPSRNGCHVQMRL